MATTLSSETEAKPHPYQQTDNEDEDLAKGSKGAFEVKNIKGGLYVRVDMPGVPNDGVKVVKYNDNRTVTFTGKSSVGWPQFDSSLSRVYGGYVALDRDPSAVDVEYDIINGCLRLFFARCDDGSLHFLSPKVPQALPPGEDEVAEEEKVPAHPYITFIAHAPQEASGIRLVGGKPDHINPFLLSGVKEVYEHKIVTVEGKQLIYIRLDVPGSSYKSYNIVENYDRAIIFSALAIKDSPFDEGSREYNGLLAPSCTCCRYKVVNHEIKDGVVRFLVSKSENLDSEPVCHCILPPVKPGGPLRASALEMHGFKFPSFG